LIVTVPAFVILAVTLQLPDDRAHELEENLTAPDPEALDHDTAPVGVAYHE
jgi:hypothetical protein